MTNTSLILLFIKAPVRGQVKTRLARALGEETALDLYQRFVLDILDTLEHLGVPIRICHAPPDSRNVVAGWLGPGRQYQVQKGSDLGERMENAFQQAFSLGMTRAVLIGSDIPDIPVSFFGDAFAALLTHDAVVGPARDGGYYLIGFRDDTFLPEIFRGITWGSGTVLNDTLAVFARKGKTVFQLPSWQDVDTIEDLRDLADRGSRSSFHSSRTMSYLAGIGQTRFSSEGSDANIRL